MSAAKIIRGFGVVLDLTPAGRVRIAGLDKLTHQAAEQVLALAREHREELRRELASAEQIAPPGPAPPKVRNRPGVASPRPYTDRQIEAFRESHPGLVCCPDAGPGGWWWRERSWCATCKTPCEMRTIQ